MDWFKCSTRLLQNPKVMLAGEDGVLLFIQLLGLNSQDELGGVVSGARARPEVLARLMSLVGQWDVQRVEKAITSLVDADLIDRGADGALEIVGFDDEWRPPASDKERARAYRDRKRGKSRGERDGSHDADVTTVTEASRSVTERHDANVTPSRNGCDAVTERPFAAGASVTPRGEERRGEESRGDSVSSSALSPNGTCTRVPSSPNGLRTGTEATAAPDGAGSKPSSGQGPARSPQPPERGRKTVKERKAELGDAAARLLEVVSGFIGDGKGPGAHELVDMAWQLDVDGWKPQELAQVLERIQQRGGHWRIAMAEGLRDDDVRRSWLADARHATDRERRVDHHFGGEFDERTWSDAANYSGELSMDPERYHELVVADRYRQSVLHGEIPRHKVPKRYAQHLDGDPKQSISPHAVAQRESSDEGDGAEPEPGSGSDSLRFGSWGVVGS